MISSSRCPNLKIISRAASLITWKDNLKKIVKMEKENFIYQMEKSFKVISKMMRYGVKEYWWEEMEIE